MNFTPQTLPTEAELGDLIMGLDNALYLCVGFLISGAPIWKKLAFA